MMKYGQCANSCCSVYDPPGTERKGDWTTCGCCHVTTKTQEWCVCPRKEGSRMTTVAGCPIHGMTAGDIISDLLL